jgi:L-aspartate oxidase
MSTPRADVIILGSGLAGMASALLLAEKKRVLIVTKQALISGASDWAQGGIAAVLDDADSVEQHVADTLSAGGGLCEESAVRYIVGEGRSAIEWLTAQGVRFTEDVAHPTGVHLTQEGGHSHRRIVHAADATGHAVQATLEERVRAHPNIVVLEDHLAIDLITSQRLGRRESPRCYGVYVLDRSRGGVMSIAASHTILATGGAGKVYRYTTNPDTASGDGIAMAWRAGCRVANMEFIQFHPTCLFHPHAKSFLISEAVRGEGGLLRLPDGSRFMPAHDERAELAPRDVVARAIDFEIKRQGLDCVYLDITHKGADFVRSHFPTIHARCLELGIDMARQPVPVVPAAHYTCGGIVTDLEGRTDLAGLYAIGETACTGLHGANRLASNSLLECVVLARAAVRHALEDPVRVPESVPEWDESRVTDPDEEVVISQNWDELRLTMWNYVGIVRTTKRLERARHRIRLLRDEISEFYRHFRVSADLLELRNLVDVADLIVESALSRRESRGLHFSRDYPETLPKAFSTVLQRQDRPAVLRG